MRVVPPFVLIGSAVCALAAGVIVGSASGATPKPPQTIHGAVIARQAKTLAPGSKVASARIVSQRVFVDSSHGFALVSVDQAQYSAATADGGKTWRIDSPALHLDAAQAPLAVVDLGAISRRVVFAYGAGNVVDVTNDGGAHWRRALWSFGSPAAVVAGPVGGLVAYVDTFNSTGRIGQTWRYVSKDGGRTWHYTTPAS